MIKIDKACKCKNEREKVRKNNNARKTEKKSARLTENLHTSIKRTKVYFNNYWLWMNQVLDRCLLRPLLTAFTTLLKDLRISITLRRSDQTWIWSLNNYTFQSFTLFCKICKSNAPVSTRSLRDFFVNALILSLLLFVVFCKMQAFFLKTRNALN